MSEERQKIYFVTTIENLGNLPLFYTNKELNEGTKTLTVKEIYNVLRRREGKRTPGFYFKLEDAVECVENNRCDIYEGCYKHVVIESMHEGLYPLPGHGKEEIWYEWKGDSASGRYEKIEKPESTKCIVNWGVG